ncbi:MAG: hypothetical protein AAFX08_01505 [Pseudomonadota bacterium]
MAKSLLLCCLASVGLTVASISPAAADEAGDEEILSVVDAFFLALATGDADALDTLVSSEALSVRLTPETDAPPRYGRLEDLAALFREGRGTQVVEPYWSPTVLRRRSLAAVWAPYEVSVDDRLVHCGIDLFTLSKQGGGWKIDSISYTVEPSACDELRPQDRSIMRPDFPIASPKENDQ